MHINAYLCNILKMHICAYFGFAYLCICFTYDSCICSFCNYEYIFGLHILAYFCEEHLAIGSVEDHPQRLPCSEPATSNVRAKFTSALPRAQPGMLGSVLQASAKLRDFRLSLVLMSSHCPGGGKQGPVPLGFKHPILNYAQAA